jgi:hypothetical protein
MRKWRAKLGASWPRSGINEFNLELPDASRVEASIDLRTIDPSFGWQVGFNYLSPRRDPRRLGFEWVTFQAHQMRSNTASGSLHFV